jgi:hypothetical protein
MGDSLYTAVCTLQVWFGLVDGARLLVEVAVAAITKEDGRSVLSVGKDANEQQQEYTLRTYVRTERLKMLHRPARVCVTGHVLRADRDAQVSLDRLPRSYPHAAGSALF